MASRSETDEIAERASTLRRDSKWREARLHYERLLSRYSAPIDKAKMQANIMQMYEEEGRPADAIRAGEDALRRVELYGLHQSDEGTYLRGFVRGRLQRLRGKPLDLHAKSFKGLWQEAGQQSDEEL
jgi:hypothetical protein